MKKKSIHINLTEGAENMSMKTLCMHIYKEGVTIK